MIFFTMWILNQVQNDKRIVCLELAWAEVLAAVAVAIAAVHGTICLRLEREFGDICTAIRTLETES